MFLFVLLTTVAATHHDPLSSSHLARGFDTTEACNASCMQCMYYRANRFFIGRMYAAKDGFDEIGFTNIENAKDAGMGKFCYWE